MYINCHSYYSLRYGTLSVERLSELAAAAGVERLVLTDINNTTGVPDFVRECRSRNITPAAGIEFRDGNRLLYIGIARNNEGFRELNEFLTRHNISGEPLPLRPPSFPNAYVIYPAGSGVNGSSGSGVNGSSGSGVKGSPGGGVNSSVTGVNGSFSTPNTALRDNEYLGIYPTAAGRLISMKKSDIAKCVILHPVTMESPADYPVHRSLRAVDNNILLSRLAPEMTGSPDEYIIPEAEALRPFSMWPQVTENTRRLLNDCSLEIDFTTPKNKKIYSASRYDDKLLLE
jgi:DNA polymerase-3 subunit alpha